MHQSPGFRLNKPLVAFQEIEGEAILINFDTGCYFSANETGSALLELADSGASTATLVQGLAERCGMESTEVEAAVAAFLNDAESEGIVVPFESDGSAQGPPEAAERLAYDAPRLEKFDDLQDLLMLDPIHDVDQVGWPMQAPADTPAPTPKQG
ncbi:PqqD family protein [Gaopeijia maritima]|uniref:PqqD family protein n=1 Tax=Gaopeijia maritima TaxID=3119007 RepID=A0ABU9E8A9_9BACT